MDPLSTGSDPSERALDPGKLPPALLRELLPLPADAPPELVLAPGIGEDACAIAIERGVLVAATDPITLTGADVGAHAVWINANDVAVTGVRPRWFLATVLLPVGTTERDARALFARMRAELDRMQVALVGGHTEVTAAVAQPIVVGQMLGFGADGRFVRTGGMREGDVLLQVGAAPIEGAAVLASSGLPALRGVAPADLERAGRALSEPGISVVEPALAAAALGATSLHDPTEGGLAGALHEVAEASGVSLAVDASAVLWFEPGVALCRAVGADPWGTLASGTLLAAFAPEDGDRACDALARDGFDVARIGEAGPPAELPVALEDGAALPRFHRDELSRVL